MAGLVKTIASPQFWCCAREGMLRKRSWKKRKSEESAEQSTVQDAANGGFEPRVTDIALPRRSGFEALPLLHGDAQAEATVYATDYFALPFQNLWIAS